MEEVDEPIEILVDLAARGEIDPWEIDVVNVADKFLERLERMKKLDLRLSARTLLYASILLRMKSEALFMDVEENNEGKGPEEGIDHPEEDHGDLAEDEYSDAPETVKIYPKLRRWRRRPITLNDLITELRKAEKVEINRRRRVERKVKENDAMKKIILDLPHEEEIEEKISRLRNRLKEMSKNGLILFSDLTAGMSVREVVDTYIPLLFLAAKREVWLRQDDLFGELYITLREGIDERGRG
ncbi:MAG TPA: segregation/condensation protein A [Candidatus Syntrophoarchaeum butanivorans]|uniref:Condensin subunit ScpA n=1 Tax=Candidatus Syntropharchaeum butanivorans TaxID=1839936 RepID=A0A1F2P4J7_9EURY|nr:MAG: condensin subunit ScpA [Candidatus Syntrophoarchaeum butanivorans]HEC57287.1 segregation/condensation protein A [Candidatus Syntrophoarchaeum butanivorans]